jgi:flagellar biosynthetic protein FliR
MRGEVLLPLGAVYGFLLVLARVGGTFVFVPLPGVRGAVEPARVVLALSLTVALAPQWPAIERTPGLGQLVNWLVLEAALGMVAGLAVEFLSEALRVAAQVVGLQAGYAYASMVDPQTQADSGILLIVAQLASGLLFFAMGLDREVIRTLARSLETYPPGAWTPPVSSAPAMVGLAGGMFSTGVRLALPAAALLVLVDIALALLGRLHSQLQLLTISFPAKMLAALAVLAWVSVLIPRLYRGYAVEGLGVVRTLLGQSGG